MKEMLKALVEINYLNEIASTLIGIIIGFFLNVFYKAFEKGIRRLKRCSFLARKRNAFQVEGIISLDHGDPFYKYDNLVCKYTKESFYLSIPQDELKALRTYNDNFKSREDTFFNGLSIKEAARGMGIDDLEELIEKHKKIVADSFIKRISSGGTLFNGEVCGVRNVVSDRDGKEENAKLIITFYNTDHFTHVVMASVYQELKERKHMIAEVRSLIDVNKYFPFTSSFGINTLLILRDENKIALAKRSGQLRNMNGIDRWHVSMNEALTITDIDEDIIDFNCCVDRGLREELGIRPRDRTKISGREFGDLFFVNNVFEMGITSVIKIGMSFNELQQKYSTAKDGELETVSLTSINMKKKDIEKFLSKNDCTQACRYCLQMLIGRGEDLL